MKTTHSTHADAPVKKSKLESFSLGFEYNRTLSEEREKVRQRTTDNHQ